MTDLNRANLYSRVWTTPMQRLAAELGFSDVGLAKICKRYKIPRPGRGYWALKEVGKAPKQVPLPKAPELANIVIVQAGDSRGADAQ